MSLLLRLVPAWVPAGLVLIATLACSVLLHQRQAARLDAAMARTALATLQAQAESAARQASEKYRALETRWHEAQRQAQEAHDAEVARYRADAARSADALQRLQRALSIAAATLRSAAAADPATAGERETAATAADLLGVCASRYRELGIEADAARAAGQQCERSFDALTAGQ